MKQRDQTDVGAGGLYHYERSETISRFQLRYWSDSLVVPSCRPNLFDRFREPLHSRHRSLI